MFTYAFMQRALIVGTLVALCAALLGVSLVLKRFAMIGDGLSHVGFGSLAIATVFNWAPLAVGIPVVVLAAFALLRLGDSGKVKSDSAIALISASALALGVFVLSIVPGMNTDVEAYLFGSILALSATDVVLSVAVCLVVLAFYLIFYHQIFAITFDETYAKATGMQTGVYRTLIAVLTALTIVVGMRMMGALLISSLIIFPTLSARWLARSFKAVTVTAAIIAVVCFWLGLTISYLYSTPTGASVVLVNLAAFALLYLTAKAR
jgi:zinc transport system permease protein